MGNFSLPIVGVMWIAASACFGTEVKSSKKHLWRWAVALFVCSSGLSILETPLRAQTYSKPRIIVTTDITNEPDDQQSLIRLLAYSNNYNIEGLIGSTGIWKLSDPATEVIHDCIRVYGQVRDRLVQHDTDFPTPEYLHRITKTGNRGYGMSAVGERGSQGARLIINAVDKEDERPVWLLAWGGANTIAQAIWTVRETRSQEELKAFLSKIRVYDLAGQDGAGAWMAKSFPDLFIIRNVLYTTAPAGSRVSIDARGSRDPDGDVLDYRYWIYSEAGTYKGDVNIQNATSSRTTVDVPKDAAGKTIHVVLTLRDKGNPPLTSYRRVVIATGELSTP